MQSQRGAPMRSALLIGRCVTAEVTQLSTAELETED